MEKLKSEFLKLLKNRRYKSNTIIAYNSWVDELILFYPKKDVKNLTYEDVKNFITHLLDKRNLSNNTVRQAFFAISTFLQVSGKSDIDLSNLKPPKYTRTVPVVPSQKEVFELIDNVSNIIFRTAISLIYSTGIEFGELVKIKIRDVDMVNETITIQTQRSRKKRHAIMAKSIKSSIEVLIQGKAPDDFLFSKANGSVYSYSVFQRALQKAREKSGVLSNYSIKSLRYAYIKHMEYFGIPLVYIIKELGLSENQSLDFYSKVGYPNIQVSFSPLDRLIVADEEEQTHLSEPYVSEERITKLSKLSPPSFDLLRLIELLRELNKAHLSKSLMSIAMIVRTIIDHVPPIFGCKTFPEVANNYSGSASFKRSMKHLDKSLRNVADSYLHVQIRKNESMPVFNQVDYRSDLDVLLSEIIRIII